MTEQTENLILEYMRRFDRQLKDFGDDVRELKFRMTNVEENLAGVQRRIDKVELRLERIEGRAEGGLVGTDPWRSNPMIS